ncbi:MAG: protein translocase subunit SecF [[Clostridium] leptum]
MKFHQFKIRFVENKKIFFGISIAVLLIGVIFNVIFGARLDIQFTGGAIVNYSFTGEINTDELAALVEETTGKSVNVNESTDIVAGEDGTINNNVSIEFAGNDALSLEGQKAMEDAIQEKYPDNGFQKLESDSVDPVNGEKFLLKCLCAVGLAAVLMIIYIAFRFRKIGGWSAGVVAVIALLHDVAVIYFTLVVFRIAGAGARAISVAVVLTIPGYSPNDTIIIYDRIRENRRIMGPKAEIGELVNASINQTLTRTINTSVATVMAVGVVVVVGLVYNLSSVVTFALPLMFGIICGCYSSTCITGPLWVVWRRYRAKKLDAKKA